MCGKYLSPLFLALLLASPQVGSQAIDSTPSLAESPPGDTSASWETLDSLLTELSSEATTLADDSERLRTLLAESRTELTRLSEMLVESRTEVEELSRLLKLSDESLGSLERLHRRTIWALWGSIASAAIFALAAIF